MPRIEDAIPTPLPARVAALLREKELNKVEDFFCVDLLSALGVELQTLQWGGGSLSADPEEQPVENAVETVLNYGLRHAAVRWEDGRALRRKVQQQGFLPTGCSSIDELLGGGLRLGTVTELVGPAASGKSQLCLQAAAAASFLRNGAVAYVDVSGAFSAQRLAHMLGGLVPGGRERVQEASRELKAALNSVVRLRAFDIHELLTLLDELNYHLHQSVQDSNFFSRLHLLILDSAAAVVAPVLGGGGRSRQGHTLMRCLGEALKSLACSHNIAVLMTNSTVRADGAVPKAALGESWKNVAQMRLGMERPDEAGDLVTVEVLGCVLANQSFGKKIQICMAKDGLKPM